ncbi:hypothetical protein HAX54_014147 [Datura stramonium]|uniref:Pre-mRNA-processing protein 40A n=1 Tax=Datura stramonium TaxID=4076 RepID=A0ABS8TPJ8_DATST|nr:hypothetical protein [Datura stramonium]
MLLQYLDDKSRIRDAVRMTEIGLTSTWMLEDFKVAIAKYISSPPISDTNLKFVFEELLERAREREEKEAKRRKRLADEFYELLHASKEITASSKWEDCKSLFGDRIMGDESLLLEIFDKFVNELKERAKEKERKRQEDKARKEKERKDREKKKEKHRRDKDRGDKSRKERERTKKDGTDSDKAETYSFEEIKRSGSDRDKKHRKRHMSSFDDDVNEKDHSRSSYRHDNDHKKSKQMDQHAWSSEANSEGQHKKQKRDHRSDSHRDDDYEDHKDWEFGEDGEVQ